MSIYVSQSLYTYALNISEFIFEVTNKSMEVYENYFQFPFAFNKYDSVFCPEYNWGAMENAGLVTFNDFYIFKEKVE